MDQKRDEIRSKMIRRLERTLAAAGCSGELAAAVVDGQGQSLPEERSLALVGLDADSVQRTILASEKLVTIAGASWSLRKWDQCLAEGHPDWLDDTQHSGAARVRVELPGLLARASVVFAGGGTATLVVPRDDADALTAGLESAFADWMEAPASAAWVPVSPNELVTGPRSLRGTPADRALLGLSAEGGGFGACLSNLAVALRRRKHRARDAFYVGARSSELRCTECGDRLRAKNSMLSDFAQTHRRRGGNDKRRGQQARTLEDLGSMLAYVHIDGRGIGDLLLGLPSLLDYAHLSDALDNAFGALADDDAFARSVGLLDERHLVVASGGDDLSLIVPARAEHGSRDALRVTAAILRAIERRFDGTNWAGKVGAGAGVVLSPSLGARFALEHARELCRSAKRAIRGEAGPRSGVDFEIVTGGTALSEGIAESRRSEHRGEDAWPGLSKSRFSLAMTQKPYSLPEFEALVDAAADALSHDVANTQIYGLRAAFDVGPTGHDQEGRLAAALLHAQYQIARDPAKSQGHLAKALGVEKVGARPEELSPRLLKQLLHESSADEPVWATGIADLVDAMKIVAPSAAAEDGK